MDDYIKIDGGTVVGRITGQLPNKSNGRRVMKFRRRGGRTMTRVAKAAKAVAWVADFITIAKLCNMLGSFAFPQITRLQLTVLVVPENMMRDLDCELLCDALEQAGIIHNDRAIWGKTYKRMPPDKINPRILFELKEYAP